MRAFESEKTDVAEVDRSIYDIRDGSNAAFAVSSGLTSAYFTAVCETIAHDMPKGEAMRYIEELAKFFNSGWKGLLRLE